MAPTFVHFALLSATLISSFTTCSARTIHQKFHQKRALVVPATLQSPWQYQSCFTDSVGARTLTGATYLGDLVTDEFCISYCSGEGYAYAGTEYSDECYCGNSLASTGATAQESDCDMACTANSSEACGGPNRLNLFYNPVALAAVSASSSVAATATSASASASSAPAGWTSLGCYTDSVNARTLTTNEYPPGQMTVELCTSTCKTAGYSLAGVEYAGECYCGNTFANGGGPAPDGSAGCNMACNGDSAETCGGSNRLNVYMQNTSSSSSITTSASITSSTTTSQTATGSAPAGWQNLGCYTDSTGARSLNTTLYLVGAMTVELCTSNCKAQGFTLSGVEYADECYCGTALQNGGAPAPDGSAGCNMACNGNAAEICGGANRLNLYGISNSTTPSTTSKSSGTSSTTSSSPSSSTSVYVTNLPTGWRYDGCFAEPAGGRTLSYQLPDNSSLTIEGCIANCIGLGYGIAGMEYTSQCFCDNFIQNNANLSAQNTDCAMPCGGNSQEICGGPNLVSVYSNATLQDYVPPGPQTTDLPGNWVYQGCLLDDAVTRTFPYQIEFEYNNTAENCLTLCSTYGYGAGGMEYGQQCFCGDAQNAIDLDRGLMPDTDCNMPCSGNSSYLCGAGNRITYYTWGGTPLNQWTFAQGDAAGEYDFLIGGLIIPLIATLGTNYKVQFMEKFGTEPANNSTGTYEFDLAEVDNGIDASFRALHVKTDIFCSAGLVLPDKVGRQINVGGWAEGATFGVRLYWPDGSPGEPSYNDWQENGNEIMLQNGRWYPTAMIMANGSILVAGGEQGSNGAPVPTMEVLPQPPGGQVIECDYLQRTDPYNLYPYMAVLPSGGIAIFYYNEARILDENTLATATVLPNMPGAVNDFLAGRSYPMEGTAMLMPQYAPYTDPLTVMICGGSTIGPEIALDNCISLQPEAAEPEWTIERMPSARVISCIAALPDGTYLILNGGQQGFAGFGLATEPNHNAILYDPNKPLNQRMTSMANTTIDRLYHSEAILLQDGRVLVSGSDPEDARFPQEYRLETFTPPYLMSGLPQPTFTINNFDWSYGQTVSISITSGSTANMRASLLGAVASTHGNSMGQRTLFPATSCGSNSCTITSPPNANVCPPGWYQLFVLDGPTPSHSTWVRIGGDPAGLGNWPDFPDFTVPGLGPVNGSVADNITASATASNSTAKFRL